MSGGAGSGEHGAALVHGGAGRIDVAPLWCAVVRAVENVAPLWCMVALGVATE